MLFVWITQQLCVLFEYIFVPKLFDVIALQVAHSLTMQDGVKKMSVQLEEANAMLQNAEAKYLAHYYDEKKSVKDLFPNTQGALRLKAILKAYSDMKKLHIPFFTADGKRNIIRAACNEKDNNGMVDHYCKRLLSEWLVDGGGDEANHKPYQAITFGNLSTALYTVWDTEAAKNSDMVKAAVADGRDSCVVLNSRKRLSILKWLRDWHNKFHGGGSLTTVEFLYKAVKPKLFGRIHKTKLRLGARSPNYQALLWYFVQNNLEGVFLTGNAFRDCKAFYFQLKNYRIFEVLRELSNATNYLHPELMDMCDLVRMMHEISIEVIGQIGPVQDFETQ